MIERGLEAEPWFSSFFVLDLVMQDVTFDSSNRLETFLSAISNQFYARTDRSTSTFPPQILPHFHCQTIRIPLQ